MTPEELAGAVCRAESDARARRGLPLSHVLDMAEFPFAFACDQVRVFDKITREAYRTQDGVVFMRAMAALALKRYESANNFLADARKLMPQEPKTAMRFAVEPPEIDADLPAVSGEYPATSALFLACDGVYFRDYCLPMMASIAANAPNTPLHIHLMGGPVDEIAAGLTRSALKVTLTHEIPAHASKNYYGAARLIRFAEALERCVGNLWMADVDALVMGNTDALFALDAAIAMRVRPGRLEPWNQFSACLVMGSRASLPYFRRTANIIKANLASLWWGIDQYALFSAWTVDKPEIHLLGPNAVSVDDTPGLFWCAGGERRVNVMTAETRYAQTFRKFRAAI